MRPEMARPLGIDGPVWSGDNAEDRPGQPAPTEEQDSSQDE